MSQDNTFKTTLLQTDSTPATKKGKFDSRISFQRPDKVSQTIFLFVRIASLCRPSDSSLFSRLIRFARFKTQKIEKKETLL